MTHLFYDEYSGGGGRDEGAVKPATFARELAQRFEARLTLLHVIEPYPSASLGAFGVSSSEFYAQPDGRRASSCAIWCARSAPTRPTR